VVTAVAMVGLGAVFAFDYRGVSTRQRLRTEEWWQAGRIRRRFRNKAVSPRWAFGVPLIIVGMIALLASVLSSIK
jgi:hypothetical protein